jgi:chemotaxis-related protein WspD
VSTADFTPTAPLAPAGAEVAAQAVHDCWNRIGVYGTADCKELERFVHCRNCPVYSSAGLQLLNRRLPPEYRQEWAEHYAREKAVANPGKVSLVMFRVGTEWLALPVRAFQEVAEKRAIHSLPHRQQGVVLGLVNIRGELLIAVSLARLLHTVAGHLPQGDHSVYERLLVVGWEGSRLVFPVDEVAGLQRFQPQDFKDLPPTLAKANPVFTRNIVPWQEGSAGLLDPDTLFTVLNRSLM